MIFQHTLQYILDGHKTQTRRIKRPDDVAIYEADQIIRVMHKGRTKYQVGKTYAVQPARNAAQVARLHLLEIRTEPVIEISEADAIAEGYTNRDEFLAAWQRIHGADQFDLDVWALTFELIATT